MDLYSGQGGWSVDGSSLGGCTSGCMQIFAIKLPEGPVIPGVLIIDGRIKTLKEFFQISLAILNNSTAFNLIELVASINLPSGLTPVRTGLGTDVANVNADGEADSVALPTIGPGQNGVGQFIIRGDAIGSYNIDVDFAGLLTGGGIPEPLPVGGSAGTTVEVLGPPELGVVVRHPSDPLGHDVTTGEIYPLIIEITNHSNRPALYTSLELFLGGDVHLVDENDEQIFESNEIRTFGHIQPGQTVSAAFRVQSLATGEIIACQAIAAENILLTVDTGPDGTACNIANSFPANFEALPSDLAPTVIGINPLNGQRSIPVTSSIVAVLTPQSNCLIQDQWTNVVVANIDPFDPSRGLEVVSADLTEPGTFYLEELDKFGNPMRHIPTDLTVVHPPAGGTTIAVLRLGLDAPHPNSQVFLMPNTTYRATLVGGTDGICSLSSGAPMENSSSWTFTTEQTRDPLNTPQVTLTNPEPGSIYQPLNQTIMVTFTNRMDPTSFIFDPLNLENSTFGIYVNAIEAGGDLTGETPVAGTGVFSNLNRTLTYTPSANLPTDAVVHVRLTDELNDVCGNPLQTSTSGVKLFNFRTNPVVPPDISDIVPGGGVPGQSVLAVIEGSNLSGITDVAIDGTGMIITDLGSGDDTQRDVRIDIDNEATLGARNVTVQTPGGTASVVFEVVKPPSSAIVDPIPAATNEINVVVSGTTDPDATITIRGGAKEVTGAASSSGDFSLQIPLKIDTSNMLTVFVANRFGNEAQPETRDSEGSLLTIISDMTPLMVTSVTPSGSVEDAALGAIIVVTFDEEVDSTSVIDEALLLEAEGMTVVGRISQTTPTTVVFTPEKLLKPHTNYVIRLPVEGLMDLAGNDLLELFESTFRTRNIPPVASAGPDQSTDLGLIVSLDGSGSSDVDGDELTFFWELINKPEGSAARLSDPVSATPSLVLDVAGAYEVRLIVNDGFEDSLPDEVTIELLTTVVGVVLDEDGSPVEGASVTTLGGQSGITGVDGSFSLSNVPATMGDITVTAVVIRDELELQGSSQPTLAVPGGITDVGAISLIFHLQYGDTVSASIEPLGDQDIYTFTGAIGDQVLVRMLPTSGGVEGSLSIRRADGSLLCSAFRNNNDSRAVNLVTDCVLDNTAPHMIFVNDSGTNEGGNYQLFLQRFNSPPNPTPIAYGEVVSSSIDPSVESDIYTFTGAIGDQVSVRMLPTSGGIEGSLSIRRADGSLLCSGLSE